MSRLEGFCLHLGLQRPGETARRLT